jgi:hypothetical protein
MGLIIKKIRGTRKGIEDIGTAGNPMKYSMVAAEAEEESPWGPLHVEQGFKKEDSAISLLFPNMFLATGHKFPSIIYHIPQGFGVTCFMITPVHAQELAKQGWTKKAIKNYLSENTRVPFYQSLFYPQGSSVFEGYDKNSLPPNPQDTIRVLPNPEGVWIFVAGGPAPNIATMRGSPRFDLGGYRVNLVTHKIDLPANGNKLVKKYRT